MKQSNIIVGQRIRDMREYCHLTREQLAEKAQISTQFLADIETGRKSMTVKTLKNLVLALGISSDYILFDSTEQQSPSHIMTILETLSLEQQLLAEELLKIYIKGIHSHRPAKD